MLLAGILIGVSLAGALGMPLWLLRRNPDKTVLKDDNEGAVPFVLLYVFSAACGIMGCLLLPRWPFLALLALGVIFPLPLQMGLRIHNRRVTHGPEA